MSPPSLSLCIAGRKPSLCGSERRLSFGECATQVQSGIGINKAQQSCLQSDIESPPRKVNTMPAKVILSIIKGPLLGREYAFEQRDTCIVGRARDCNPRLPDDADHKIVSRHHCLFDINPPEVSVRDF